LKDILQEAMMIRLTAVCLVLCSGMEAFAQCPAPRYRTGITPVNSDAELIMSISIPLRDFAPNRLVCLATSLKERYRGRKSVIVSIFSSYEAASHSLGVLPPEAGKFARQMLARMHGRYVFSAERHVEYLELMPTLDWERTRIDLPVVAAPHCRVEIAQRCLIESHGIDYPWEAVKLRASGSVALTATFARDGKVSRVRLVKAQSVPEGAAGPLADAAVQNLSSWRLEPGPRAETVRITYSYVIDRSLPWNILTEVRWIPPDEIAIRGNPRE
jgi:hypothetical protein